MNKVNLKKIKINGSTYLIVCLILIPVLYTVTARDGALIILQYYTLDFEIKLFNVINEYQIDFNEENQVKIKVGKL